MAYKEQFDRVKRYYKRIDPEKKDHGNQLDYEDNLWSFFQNAYHLKDWIKNDDTIRINGDIEDIKKGYPCLVICGDIANRTKHLKLHCEKEDAPHPRQGAKLSGKDVNVCLPPANYKINDILRNKPVPISKGSTAIYNYRIIDSSGEEYNAINLAEQIIEAWTRIIELHIIEES